MWHTCLPMGDCHTITPIMVAALDLQLCWQYPGINSESGLLSSAASDVEYYLDYKSFKQWNLLQNNWKAKAATIIQLLSLPIPLPLLLLTPSSLTPPTSYYMLPWCCMYTYQYDSCFPGTRFHYTHMYRSWFHPDRPRRVNMESQNNHLCLEYIRK